MLDLESKEPASRDAWRSDLLTSREVGKVELERLRCIFDAVHATMCRRDTLVEVQVADGLVASFRNQISYERVVVLHFQRIVHLAFRSRADPMKKHQLQTIDQKRSLQKKCEGGVDVAGVVTPLGGVEQVIFHGVKVVEVGVQVRVHEDRGEEEDKKVRSWRDAHV